MPPSRESQKKLDDSAAQFGTTHWSVVLAARESGSHAATEALEQLCANYWPPLYAYLRRCGHSPADAQDLTQEFFSRFLDKDYLQHLRHAEGRFRSFLLTFLKHFLSDARDRAHAQKRGGGWVVVSLDETSMEEAYLTAQAAAPTPEEAFEHRWAQRILEEAVRRLREEYAAGGKAELFEALKDVQPGERGPLTYAEIGTRLGLSEGGVKTAVHRLHQRHREVLRDVVAHTVNSPLEVDEEIRHLIAILGGR